MWYTYKHLSISSEDCLHCLCECSVPYEASNLAHLLAWTWWSSCQRRCGRGRPWYRLHTCRDWVHQRKVSPAQGTSSINRHSTLDQLKTARYMYTRCDQLSQTTTMSVWVLPLFTGFLRVSNMSEWQNFFYSQSSTARCTVNRWHINNNKNKQIIKIKNTTKTNHHCHCHYYRQTN